MPTLYKQKHRSIGNQKGKMQGMKEGAANVGASAKAGMEKAKASTQEKMEKMTTHDPMQKEMATQKKDERKAQAELDKQEARENNAASKQAARAGGDPRYTTGGTRAETGTTAHSATGVPHGSGQPGHNVRGGTYT